MATRHVPLARGDIAWLFPMLAAAEQDAVLGVLRAADDAVWRAGARLGAPPGARFMGIPLNRLVYCRLGPAPGFTATILTSEGWSEQVFASVTLAPAGGSPYTRPGPPWEVQAEIGVRCDADPDGCRWHAVDELAVRPVGTPAQAATELLAASRWLLQRTAEETEQSLRARDPQRGHPPGPRHVD